jgi:hypothetical protein
VGRTMDLISIVGCSGRLILFNMGKLNAI